MSNQLRHRMCYLLIFLPQITFANSEITYITADRIQADLSKSASDIRVITSAEIAQSSSHTLSEILLKESDVSITNSSMFLRGTDSSHVLFVLDGIIMNDPSNPNRQFDVSQLSLNNIDHVEILKGSQGLAYGSNAIGGVVALFSKKAKSTALQSQSSISLGSYKTLNASTNLQKQLTDILDISLGADYFKTDGFSSSDKKYYVLAEDDGEEKIALDFNSNIKLSNKTSVQTNTRFIQNRTDLDKGGGAGADDPNDIQREQNIYSKINLNKIWAENLAETNFNFSFSKHHRINEEIYDSIHTQQSYIKATGIIKNLGVNHTYYATENLTQNINLDFLTETDHLKNSAQNIGFFIYHQYELPKTMLNFGIRLDHNNTFDNHLTYKVAASKTFVNTQFKISHSTGFRAPSLNQLYDQTYGNKNLTPEVSRNAELSLEQNWQSSFKTTTSLFYTKINNRFSYNPISFININAGEAEITGLENKLSIIWPRNIEQELGATLLNAKDLSLKKKLARRSDLSIKNVFRFLLDDKNSLSLENFYTGARPDVDNLGNSTTMDSFILNNFNYKYKIDSHNEFYFYLKNIFNTDYQEIYGFGTAGRTFTVGANYNF